EVGRPRDTARVRGHSRTPGQRIEPCAPAGRTTGAHNRSRPGVHMKKLVGTLALSGLMALALAGPAAAAHEGTAYRGSLSELNRSGGSGQAYIEVSEDGETMTVG